MLIPISLGIDEEGASLPGSEPVDRHRPPFNPVTLKHRSSCATAPRSSRRGHRRQIATAVFILVFGGVAIVAERWLAALFDDNLIATMFVLIASIVMIALVSPLVARTHRSSPMA